MSFHQLYFHVAEREAVFSDNMMLQQFGVTLGSRLGGLSVLNATACRWFLLADQSGRGLEHL